MAETKKLVIVISRGFDDERSSVAWSIANAGIASDMEVTVFLVASGVGYAEDDLIEGITIAGAPAMLEVVKQGAATLSF